MIFENEDLQFAGTPVWDMSQCSLYLLFAGTAVLMMNQSMSRNKANLRIRSSRLYNRLELLSFDHQCRSHSLDRVAACPADARGFDSLLRRQ